ncbi:MAG: hypothetical protein LBM68_03595 [Bacteroidales bacterium]|jgi:hypothetical protein|nr:hypothetical protein [Bacteroidales bacterium]
MKTRMLIFAMTFCSVQMFASEIIFTSNSSKPFQIVIDNYCYTSENGMIAINNVNSGTYRVQIAGNPDMFGEFKNISYQTISVNPYTRTFCEVSTYGTSSIAYIEALRPSSNVYVTVNLRRPAIHNIVYTNPIHRPVAHAKPATNSRPIAARPVNSRPAPAQAHGSRTANNTTYGPRPSR